MEAATPALSAVPPALSTASSSTSLETSSSSLSEEEQALSTALRALSVNSMQPRAIAGSPDIFCVVPESCVSVPASPLAAGSHVTPSPSPSAQLCGRCVNTPGSSGNASPAPCSICLSPVHSHGRKGGRRSSISKNFSKFRTQCCGQLFHKECLARHKAQATSPSNPRACPLCRSVQPTGLTPSNRPQPTATGGSFVNGWQLHNEMVRRVSAARGAVQRSLAARRGGPTSPAGPQSVFFTSPGAAAASVRVRSNPQSRIEAAAPAAPVAPVGPPAPVDVGDGNGFEGEVFMGVDMDENEAPVELQ